MRSTVIAKVMSWPFLVKLTSEHEPHSRWPVWLVWWPYQSMCSRSRHIDPSWFSQWPWRARPHVSYSCHSSHCTLRGKTLDLSQLFHYKLHHIRHHCPQPARLNAHALSIICLFFTLHLCGVSNTETGTILYWYSPAHNHKIFGVGMREMLVHFPLPRLSLVQDFF